MMKKRHISPADLVGKVIDCHTHVGTSWKAFACGEYPYAQSIEGLHYRQQVTGIDVGVVFPFSPELYLDAAAMRQGHVVPAVDPPSPAPYVLANERLMAEVFRICPEYRQQFLPFVSVDPGREVAKQIEALLRLEEKYPVYGIKISPVMCQTRITELLAGGSCFLDYAAQRDIPFLLHCTSDEREGYSRARWAFEVVEARPDLRFCLAHCIGCHRDYLERAHATPNVWVDTAALKIQVQLAYENNPVMAAADVRMEGDYSDCHNIMRALMARYPETILWGSDSPYYTFICQRRQAEGVFQEFRAKALYEDEVAALNALEPALRRQASNTNTLRFLFGAPRL